MKKTLTTIAIAAISGTSAWAVTSVTNANFSNVTDTTANQVYNITGDVTLGAIDGGDAGDGTAADTEYVLEGFVFVNPGATLTIEEGTIIRGQPFAGGTNVGSLIVSRGGAINAVGSQTAPIIFTTAAKADGSRYDGSGAFLDSDPLGSPLPAVTADASATGNTGLWGAVTLLGYAPTNRGLLTGGIGGEAQIEGFGDTSEATRYGGRISSDSSGVMQYVSIRHSGRAISEGDEQQGLTLGGVGNGTILENIDIYCSQDDGIEIFGGTVNLKNVMISYVNDDGFDLDQGYTGNVQNLFILASNLTNPDGNATTETIGEWDGDDSNRSPIGQPFSNPTIYNLTAFCEGAPLLFNCKSNFGGNIYNAIILDAADDSFIISNSASGSAGSLGYGSSTPSDQSVNGTLNFAGIIFAGSSSTASTSIAADAWSLGVMTNNGNGLAKNAVNNTLVNASTSLFFGLGATGGNVNAQTTPNGLNPVPLAGVDTGLIPNVGTFFDEQLYKGAFPTDLTAPLWTTGWTTMNLRGILVDNAQGDNIL